MGRQLEGDPRHPQRRGVAGFAMLLFCHYSRLYSISAREDNRCQGRHQEEPPRCHWRCAREFRRVTFCSGSGRQEAPGSRGAMGSLKCMRTLTLPSPTTECGRGVNKKRSPQLNVGGGKKEPL